MRDDTLSRHDPVKEFSDQVVCDDIAGTTSDGQIPPRFIDECRLALECAQERLAAHGLMLRDVRHFAYMVRDIDAFGQCQSMIVEALGRVYPIMTLRLVTELPREGQRIAFSLLAERA